jgi:uncharacterized protein YegJ (DUF2314 family)
MGATYTLDSGAERYQEAPEMFEIPSEAEREALKPGQLVKLIFRIEVDGEVHVERMWVQIEQAFPEYYVGTLDNKPYCTDEIAHGTRIEFHADHVIQIWREET